MDIKTFKFTNLKLSSAFKDYVSKKLLSLNKFLKNVGLPQDLYIEVGKSTKHHKTGKIFRVEAMVKLPGKMLRAELEEYDLRAATDLVYDDLSRQIRRYKNKLIAKNRRVKKED